MLRNGYTDSECDGHATVTVAHAYRCYNYSRYESHGPSHTRKKCMFVPMNGNPIPPCNTIIIAHTAHAIPLRRFALVM